MNQQYALKSPIPPGSPGAAASGRADAGQRAAARRPGLGTAAPSAGPAASTRRAWISFAIFALVTGGSGWLFVALDHASGAATGTGSASSAGGSAGQGLWLIVPALTGLVLYLLTRRRERRLGVPAGPSLGLTFRIRHRAWPAAIAVGFPVMFLSVAMLAAAGAGVMTFHANVPGKAAMLPALVTVAGFMVVKNLIEEFIFRGCGMASALRLGLGGGIRPHLLVGVVWGLWHLPLMLAWMSQAEYHSTTSVSRAVYVPMFFLSVLAMAVIYGELRIRSGSIWPGVLLHTISGAPVAMLLADHHLVYSGHWDAVFSPNANSLISIVSFALVAYLIVRRKKSRPAGQLAEAPTPAG